MEKEKLTYDIIESFLRKELKKTKHIMTWGTIGSLNINHDIDTIITKKPYSPSADFFKEIHTIFEKLDRYLYNNFKFKLIRFAHSVDEYLIAEYTPERKIMFHTMVYISFPQIKKDWEWAIDDKESIALILKRSYNCIYGEVENLFSKDFQKEIKFENVFTYLYLYDYLNSNLPRELLIKIMNSCFEYLYKKRLKIENPVANNEKEIKKYFYKLCNILDEMNKPK
ncbi:hypothetical protein J4438_01720 [Candidatus Woesearchaeota archaeon]|nr:hypothetical protein [Candidatus Woesearchaeota archaeon]